MQPEMIEVIGKLVSPMDCKDMLRLCYQQAKLFSHDPNTRNGAIIVNKKGLIIGTGANRMPHNSLCTDENLQAPKKYPLIEHAERDAVYSAARWTAEKLDGCTMFCPFACCPDCARAIGLVGISNLVVHKQCKDRTPERWQEPIAMGHDILRRMGVGIIEWSGVVGGFENRFDGKDWTP
jgi:dCMP deaminase